MEGRRRRRGKRRKGNIAGMMRTPDAAMAMNVKMSIGKGQTTDRKDTKTLVLEIEQRKQVTPAGILKTQTVFLVSDADTNMKIKRKKRNLNSTAKKKEKKVMKSRREQMKIKKMKTKRTAIKLF